MPIEIRELIIRVAVDTKPEEQQTAAPALPEEVYARLVEQCVRQVLLALRRERER